MLRRASLAILSLSLFVVGLGQRHLPADAPLPGGSLYHLDAG